VLYFPFRFHAVCSAEQLTVYFGILAHTVLVITAGVLFYAAWIDLREFKIRNELILVLAGLFVLHAILSGRWVEIHWNILVALVIFIVLLFFYARNWLAGGDIKLLTVSFLWIGYTCALPFAILLMAFSIITGLLAKFGLVKTPGKDISRVPFAPAIAAALIGTFLLGCLDIQPVHHIPNIPLGDQRK
jgi:prepilin peptidase CpaA